MPDVVRITAEINMGDGSLKFVSKALTALDIDASQLIEQAELLLDVPPSDTSEVTYTPQQDLMGLFIVADRRIRIVVRNGANSLALNGSYVFYPGTVSSVDFANLDNEIPVVVRVLGIGA